MKFTKIWVACLAFLGFNTQCDSSKNDEPDMYGCPNIDYRLTVKGSVADEAGGKIADAKVKLSSPANTNGQTGTTDEQGQFTTGYNIEFEDLALEYSVVTSKEGYVNDTVVLTLKEADFDRGQTQCTKELDIVLKKK